MSDDLQENYRTLDLEPGAPSEDVRRAYRDLVKVWHPDRFTHDPILQGKAQEKLKRINNAYEQIRKREASASHRKHAQPSAKAESRKKSSAEQRPRTPVPEMGRVWTVPDLGLVLLPIAPGTFTMGSDSIFFRSDEKPVTRVMLTHPFWLGKYQVTQREWNAVMGKNWAKFPGETLPVEMVSWTEVMQFCQKLADRERLAGRLPDGYDYSLPTEAQWEYACRAGTPGDYAGNVAEMAWYDKNSGQTTHPVGQKQANGWGLHDMHGNVREWCADCYRNKLPGGSVRDPLGPSYGRYNSVVRGGSWACGPDGCRSGSRDGMQPAYRFDDLGFRLALVPYVDRWASMPSGPGIHFGGLPGTGSAQKGFYD